MRESGPRQPSNLDPIDRDSLANLGRRIERWDILKDGSKTFDERKAEVFNDLEAEIDSLNAQIDAIDDVRIQESIESEIAVLLEEEEQLRVLKETQGAFDELADEREAHHAQVRREYLEGL